MSLGPEHIPQICECFKAVQSVDQNRKAAEATLEQLSTYQGFCSCLAEIIADRSNDQVVRWFASVHLKNTTQRVWKRKGSTSTQHAITEEEKAHLRTRLLDLLREDDGQIAVQLCIAVARIARVDFPNDWPALIPTLMEKLAAAETDMLGTRRGYLALHHLLKELASKRMPADRRTFEQITAMLLPVMIERWFRETGGMMENLPAALGNPMAAQQLKFWFERWLLLLSILKRLVMAGVPSDASSLIDNPAVAEIMAAVLQALQVLIVQRPAVADPRNQLHAMLDRGLLKLAKTLRGAVDAHPWSLRLKGVLKGALEFFANQVVDASSAPQGGPSFPQFRVQSMLFIHAVLTCPSYKSSLADGSDPLPAIRAGLYTPAEGTEGRIKQLEVEVYALGGLSEFRQPSVLASLISAVIERYFPLTPAEMEEMESDPETYHHDNDASSYEDQLRPCSETFFLTLLEQDRPGLAPHVASILQTALESCPPGTAHRADLPCISGVPAPVLMKEAVYGAVGTGSYEMHDYVDFEPWFQNHLLPEVLDTHPRALVLRRRAAIVIGQWVAKMPDNCRASAYQALVALLQCTDHVSLQLAALKALRMLIDDWGFFEDHFQPFIGPTLEAALNMLPGIDQLDTQLQVFSFLALVTERMAEGIQPFAPQLLQAIPSIWGLGEGQPLLRVQVLLMLGKLVNALGPDSAISYPIVGPILRTVTNPESPDELHQLEDGLALWLVALRNATTLDMTLLEPFGNLVKVFEFSTEHVRVGMQIITSCILLGGGAFLEHFGAAVVQILTSMIGALNEKGLGVLLPVMELLVQCFPAEAPPSLETALLKLLSLILAGHESSLTLSAAFRVLSRIVLQNGPYWMRLMELCAAQTQPAPVSLEAALCALIDVWVERFDTLAQPHVRKQNALALAACLSMPFAGIAERVPGLVKVLVKVWDEELDDISAELMHFRVLDYEGENDAVVQSSEAQGEFERRTKLTDADPLLQFSISSFLRDRLGEATANPTVGPAVLGALNSLPPALAEGLQRVLEGIKPDL